MSGLEESMENGMAQEAQTTSDMPPPYPGKPEKHGSKTDGNASFLRAARAGNLDKVLEYLKGSTDINTSNANGLNALHLASKEGHVNIVTELLKRGANVDAATKKGNTALHIASLAGQEEIVKILVQNGAKVNVQSQNGFTPLYMASQENHADVVKYLLANGASQGLATEDGFTPLAVALQQGHDKVVAVLLENDTRGKVRLPALHIAAKKDDVKAATLLLQNEHNIDGTSKSGFTPLHIASHYGNMNVGTLLIEKGADVNFKARNSILPLHVASKWGRTNMVTLLLDNGGLIDGKTRDGLCPLHCGARSGHEQVVDLLLERGANVCAKTKNGLSPLHMAAQGDHVDCARLLLYHKAPIDDVTVDYLTPLHVAAHCGNVRTAKLLLDRKCEVNARALNGFTPLHIACKKNRIKVVELLLKYGASIEATTESGLTPLHVASFMGHMNIVVYLLQHGANPDTPTVRGETALHLAARANQTDIIRILLRNGATVDAKAREQQTPLHIASRLGNENNVVLLLQHGASPDATTKDLYTPLHIAAKEGHEEVAAALLDHGASQNLTTKKGFTPLHIAAKYGNIKVVKLLLQKEADPNVQGKNGLTPLHVATHYNHVDVAMMLLENGASPHCTAKNGYTPLHIAAKKNQMDIASTLLEYGAKPNAESKNGFTPLHLASQEGHVDMVSLLLERDADVNCRAKNGLTPMHLAAQEDKVPVAEVLCKYGAEIDPQTKAGYTPLHTACHFGQINMIRFLLEQGASVNATTKLGYTPLHQAAQQGHVLVINLLLKYKASPNAVTNTGQTPYSIAQRLGYISVVEILKHITEVQVAQPSAQDEKYKVVSPETMQETLMTDSEDEGGEDTILGDQSMSIDDMKFLGDDSITPIRSPDEYYLAERYSTTTASTLGQDDFRSHFLDDSDMGPVFEDQVTYRARRPEEKIRISSERSLQRDSGDFNRASGDFGQTMSSALETSRPYETSGGSLEKRQEEKLQQTLAPAPPMLAKPGGSMEEARAMYGSYSGASFASSFDPDNVALDRHPIYSGFLVSFMVDARGGAMRGCRHSGVRIIVPPGKACMPTRVTCKLVKKEKLTHPPPMMEGEALASRILEMGPVGAKFQGPVIIEVPHFASLRGKEREIVILRSDNGETWREHNMEATEEAIQEALNGSFEDLESAEELYNKRITRILTSEFPNYFAIVTRIRQETKSIGPESGMLSSTVVPQVQAVFPEGSLTKKIKVGLQAQPVPPEMVSKMLGNRVAVSPIVTVEPRRRKFHKPITLTIPLPKASQKGMTNPYSNETPTLRLLCSITGGTSPAQWEDITGTTPLTFVNDCVSFTTTVSARFWLMDCQNINEAAKMATELYRDTVAVPFMAKFVVFAKSHENLESRLRVFCMTDDKMDKTLESQEQFKEIARSKDVEVLEGKPQYLEMAGNLVPVTKSGDQLFINFHGFRENRLPFTVRIRDSNQEPVGRLAFMKEPKVGRGEAPQTPICNLNIRLPDTYEKGEGTSDIAPGLHEELQRKFELARGLAGENQDDQISKAELRLTDIADALQGDWVVLGRQLEITDDEIAKIQSEYNYVSEQSLVMLHLWVQKNGEKATGNSLERALRKIGREDVIRKCMYNIEEVTDEVERAVAKVHIDQPGFDAMKEELGPSRDSSMHRGMSLDVSYDEQDIMKESESVEGSETGSLKEQRPGRVLEQEIREERRKPEPVSSPIQDLIERAEAEQVHGMDDRRASLSSEEDFKGGELGIQAKAKTKTPPSSPTSGDKGPEQDVGDSYLAGRVADAQTLGDSVQPGQARLDSQEQRRPPAPLAAKEEVIKKSAVTKTQAEYAEPTFEDWVQQREIQAPAPLRSQDIDDQELYAGPAVGEALAPEGTTFEDWVASKELKPSEAVSIEPAGEIRKDVISVQEYDEKLDDGSVVHHKITVTEHVQPVVEKRILAGVENVRRTEKKIGTEVEDSTTEFAPDVKSIDDENVETETSVADEEDVLPDGTWERRKIIVNKVQRVEPPAGLKDSPVLDVRKVAHGDIQKKVMSLQEYDEELPDGSTVHRKITVTDHIQPYEKITVREGFERSTISEERVGREIEEAITEIPPGVTDLNAPNLEKSTSVEDAEEKLSDGTWQVKRFVNTKVSLVRAQEAPVEEKFAPMEAASIDTLEEFAPATGATLPSKQITAQEVQKREAGDIKKNVVSVQEFDDLLPDGTKVHRKVTVIEHVQPVSDISIVAGIETAKKNEETIGIEIEELVTEVAPSITNPDEEGLERITSEQNKSSTLPDGTWQNKRVVTTRISPAPIEQVDGRTPIAQPHTVVASVKDFKETLPDGTTVLKRVTVTDHIQPFEEKVRKGTDVFYRPVEEKIGSEVLNEVSELAPGITSPTQDGTVREQFVEESDATMPDGTWQKTRTITDKVEFGKSQEAPKDTVLSPSEAEAEFLQQAAQLSISPDAIGEELTPAGPVKTQITSVRDLSETLPDGTSILRKVTVIEHIQPFAQKQTDGGVIRLRTTEQRVGTEVEEDRTELAPGVTSIDQPGTEVDKSVQDSEQTLPDGTWEKTKVITTKVRPVVSQVAAPSETVLSPAEAEKQFLEQAAQLSISPDAIGEELNPVGPTKTRVASVRDFTETLPDGTEVSRKVTVTEHIQPLAQKQFDDGVIKLRTTEQRVGTEVEEDRTELAPGVTSIDQPGTEVDKSVQDSEQTLPDGTWEKTKVITTKVRPVVSQVTAPSETVLSPAEAEKQFLEQAAQLSISPDAIGEELTPVGPTKTRVASVRDFAETLPDGTEVSRKVTVTEHIQPLAQKQFDDGVIKLRTTEQRVGTEVEEDRTELAPGVTSIDQPGTEVDKSVQDSEQTLPDGTWEKTKVITTKVRPVVSQVTAPSETVLSPAEAEKQFLEQAAQLSISPDAIGEELTSIGPTKTHVASIRDFAETLPDGTTVTRKVTVIEHVQPCAQKQVDGDIIRLRTSEQRVGTEIEEDRTELAPGVSSVDQPGTEAQKSVQDSEQTLPDGTWEKTKVITTKVVPVSSQLAPPTQTVLSPTEAEKQFLEQAAQLSISPDSIGEQLTPAGPTKTHVASVRDFAETLLDGTTVTRKVTVTEHIQPFAQKQVDGDIIRLRTTEQRVGTQIEEDRTELAPGIRSIDQPGTEIDKSVQDSEQTLPDGTWEKTKVITTKVRPVISKVTAPSETVLSPAEAEKQFLEQATQLSISPDAIGEQLTPVGPTKTHVASVRDFAETLPDGTTVTRKVTITEHIQPFAQKQIDGDIIRLRTTEQRVGTEIEEEKTELAPGIRSVDQPGTEVDKSVEDSEKTLPDGTWEKTKVITTKVIPVVSQEILPSKTVLSPREAEKQFLEQAAQLSISPDAIGEELTPIGPTKTHVASMRDFTEALPDGTTVTRKVKVIEHVQPCAQKQIEGDVIRLRTSEQRVGTEIEEDRTELAPGVSNVDQPGTEMNKSVQDSEKTLPDGTWEKTKVITTKVVPVVSQVTAPSETVLSPAEAEKQFLEQAAQLSISPDAIGEEPTPIGPTKTHVANVQELAETLPDGTTVTRKVTVIEHVQPCAQKQIEGDVIRLRTSEQRVGTEIEEDRTELAPGISSVDQPGTEVNKSVQDSEHTLPDGTWKKTKVITTKVVSVSSQLAPPKETVLSPAEANKQFLEQAAELSVSPDAIGEQLTPIGPTKTHVASVRDFAETKPDGTTVTRKVTVTEHIQPFAQKQVDGDIIRLRTTEQRVGTQIEEDRTELAPGIRSIDQPGTEIDKSVQDSEQTLPDGTWEKTKVTTTKVVPVSSQVAPPTETVLSPAEAEKQFLEQAAQLSISPDAIGEQLTPAGPTKTHVASVRDFAETLPDGTTVTRKITVIEHIQPFAQKQIDGDIIRLRSTEQRVGTQIEEDRTELAPGIRSVDQPGTEAQKSVQDSEQTLPDGTWEKTKVTTTKVRPLVSQVTAPSETVLSPAEAKKQFVEQAAQLSISPDAIGEQLTPVGPSKTHVASVRDFAETLPDGTTVTRKVTITEHIQPFAQKQIDGNVIRLKTSEQRIGTEVEEVKTELAPGVLSVDQPGTEVDKSVQDSEKTLPDGTWEKTKVITTTVHLVPSEVTPEKPVVISPAEAEKQFLEQATQLSVSPDAISEELTPIGPTKTHVASVRDFAETLPDGTTVTRKVTVTEHIQLFAQKQTEGGVIRLRTTEQLVGTVVEEDRTELAPGIKSEDQPGTEINKSVQDSEHTLPDGTWEKTKVITTKVRPVVSQVTAPSETVLSPAEAEKQFLEQAAQLSINPDAIGEELTPIGPTKTHVASVRDYAETLPDGTAVTRKVTVTELIQPFAQKQIHGDVIRLRTTEQRVGTEVEEDRTELAPGVRSVDQPGTCVDKSVQDSEKTMPDGTYEKTKVITTKVSLLDSEVTPQAKPVISPAEAEKQFLEQAAQLSISPDAIGEQLTPIGPTKTHVASVRDFAETLPDGTTVTRKVSVTEHVQPFAQKQIDGGVIRLRTTEQRVGTQIEEDRTELGPGVKSVDQLGTKVQQSVKDSEQTLPDGTWERTKVKTTKVQLVSSTTQSTTVQSLEQFPGLRPDEIGEGKTPVGPARTHVASVKEYSETLPDGSNIARKITITEHIQQFSQKRIEGYTAKILTTEEKVGRDILEEVTELGPGVETPNQEGSETSKSEKDSEKTLPDGTWEKTKVVTTKVRLSAEAEAAFLAKKQQASPLLTQPIEELKEGKHPTGEPRIHLASVRETEETLPTGVTVRRKITENKHIQAFTEKTIEGDQIRVRTAEEIVGTEIEEDVIKMGPGVRDPNQEHTHRSTSEDSSEDKQPDGTWLRRKIITTTVELDKSVAPPPELSSEKQPFGDPRTHTASIKEFEERLPDGTIIHRRVTTIQHIQAFRQRMEEEGFIKVRTAEEVVGTEIIENRTEMGPGVYSPDQEGAECVTSEKESEEPQPDGTWQRTKVVTTKITLKAPVEQKHKVTMEAKKVPQFPPEGFDGEYEEEEYEETLPDGSIVQKRVMTCRSDRMIIRKIITETEDGEVTEEIISEDLSGAELRSPQKSKEQAAADAAVAIEEQLIKSEMTSSAAKAAPVLQKAVNEDDILGELQAAAERKKDFDEVEEVLPDGSTVRRKILKTKVKKTVTKKIRRIGPDGEVIEDVITEEIPESELSETSSMHSSLSDARDVYSPVPSISSPGDLASPAESDSERPSVRVYTDTIEGEPQVETDVQEFEETLPDGSIIKRKVIKTRQKQTIVKRVVMEGPEDDLPTSDEQAQLMLMQEGLPDYPDIKVYTDHAETEPETSTDVQEFEETLEDGTIVKKKVLTKTEQQMKTERTVMEGQGHIPGLADADELAALEAELAAAEHEADAAGKKLQESQTAASEGEIVPDIQSRSVPPQAGPLRQPQLSLDDEEIVQEVAETVESSALSQKSAVQEEEIIPVPRETQPAPGLIEEKLQSAQHEVTESAPVVDIPESQAHIEDMLTSPASMASDGTVEFEDAQEELLMTGDEGHLEEAAGGDMQETRVVMRKQVHKKTVIRDGKEETIVTEDTHVEQDNEGPEELRDSMQELIDQFMEGKGEIPKDPALTQ